MDARTLAIPLAFILLAAMLCLLLIGTKWRWWQKLLLIVVVPCFGLVVWGAIDSYKGWPSDVQPPQKTMVLAATVREPDPSKNDPGEIFLWLVPLDAQALSGNPLEYAARGNEPRGYRIPYSRKMHEAVDKAREKIRAGRPVVMDMGKKKKGDDRARRGDSLDHDQPSGDSDHIGGEVQVYDLPPPHPPIKD